MTVSTSKHTFDQVLRNQTTYPYNQESFAAFLERSKSSENLDFWLAVRHYKFYCYTFFSERTESFPIDDANSSEFELALENLGDSVILSNGATFRFNSSEESRLPLSEATHFALLKEKLFVLLKTFILPGSKKEINIPQKVRTLLLREVTVKNNFHPAVLRPARDLTFNLMRESSYAAWAREVASAATRQTDVAFGSHLRKDSMQSRDSGVSSMGSSFEGRRDYYDCDYYDDNDDDEEDDDRRSVRLGRLLDRPFTKHVLRIKRSLSPLARGLKDFATQHHQNHNHQKIEPAPKSQTF